MNQETPLAVFQKLYIEYVNDDDMYANFVAFNNENAGADTEVAMKEFIVDTNNFRRRVSSIMERVLPALVSDAVTDDRLQRLREQCIDAFRVGDFSVARLTDVVRQTLSREEDATARSDDGESTDDTPATLPDASEQHAEDASCTRPDLGGLPSYIELYERASSRPMYACELVSLQGLYGDQLMHTDARAVSQRVAALYDLVCDAVVRYEGRHITQHEFARHWLTDIARMPTDDVAERLTRALMDGAGYHDGMQERIVKKYTALLGSAPSPADVAYVFAIAAGRRMHLLDDSLDELLTDVWEERKNDSREIAQTYADTYGRLPDDDEIARRVAEFRSVGVFGTRDYERLRAVLRRELCADLEYRDVVKDMVCSHFQDVKGCKIPARLLYNTLKQVLDAVSDLHDDAAVRSAIARAI